MAASASSSKHEVRRIVDQLQRAIQGDAWHGPSWKEIIAEIDDPSPRMIELTLHAAAWLDISRQRLTGPVDVTDELNFPSLAGVTWVDAQQRLWQAADALAQSALELDDSQLDLPLPGKPNRSIYIELHGTIQHAIYHAGQVMLLHRIAVA